MTVREAVHRGQASLREAGVESPYLDAVLLLSNTLGYTKEQLFARLPDALPPKAWERFERDRAARAAGTPVAYLVGSKEFYGRTFRVDSRALVPRPDTETLIEAAPALLPNPGDGPAPSRIHDCCTGTGCIAITLAAERPDCAVSASDVNADALSLFRENCRALLGEELPCCRSDLLADVDGPFDLITANPPYVDAETVRGMPSVAGGEPALALEAGVDGLDVFRRLIPEAFSHLADNGYFITEIGFEQAAAVRGLFSDAGFTDIETREDLEGRDRVCWGRRTT